MKTVRLFLSSPGDCSEERTAVHQLAEKINGDPLVSSYIRLEIVAWDWGTGVPLDAIYSPQTSVNQHLPAPENCDLFIGIFRCRFGTPLPSTEFSKDDGQLFLSGSEYEFFRAWQAKRLDYGFPHHIWLYRWSGANVGWFKRSLDKILGKQNSCPNNQQLENLNSFFNSPPFKIDTTWTGSVHRFDSTGDFCNQLDGHLRRFLSQWTPNATRSIDSWCLDQANKITSIAGPRYTADAHVTTDIGTVFDWLLKRKNAISDFDSSLAKLWNEIQRKPEFDGFANELKRISDGLRSDPTWKITPNFSNISELLQNVYDHAITIYHNLENAAHDKKDTDQKRWSIRQIASSSRDAKELIDTFSGLSEKRVLLLTGPSGQGKTHTLIHQIHKTLQDNGITFGILGQELSGTGDLWTEIKQHLDYDGPTSSFLDNLENEAANRNQRALIVFDALNETNDRSRWSNQLLGLLNDILKRPHISVAISIRSDYLNFVLPEIANADDTPWISWSHPGFSGVEPDALIQYFAHYGVKAPVAPPLGELSNPLYVQLLAKSLQNSSHLKHWLPSWLEVWSTWIDKLEIEATQKLDLDPSRAKPIRRSMEKLADSMLDNNRYIIPRTEADEIATNVSGSDRIISFLCSSGALIDRIDDQNNDVIEFAYERLTDTFIIDRILNKLFSGLETPEEKKRALSAALSAKGELYPLACGDWIDHPLHYRRAGLLKALCLAAPKHISAEIPELLDIKEHENDWLLPEAFTDSLRWRSELNEFGTDHEGLWKLWETWGSKQDSSNELDNLIGFSFIPGHPFEIDNILHTWLLNHESIGQRDAEWSIDLVTLWHSDESITHQLIKWSNSAKLHGIYPEVALPIAKLLAWMTSTSQRGMREKVIRGLTRLIVASPEIVEHFLPDFLKVNDPYIVEASLIATLGLVGSHNSPAASEKAADLVYENIFLDHENTWCHLSIRHYARRILEVACEKQTLDKINLAHTKPPYSSSLPLDKVPNKDELKLLDDSRGFQQIIFSATGWDFYRYVMGGNSASLDFSSTPKEGSSEPSRPFSTSENQISQHAKPAIFDLALASRFVAWNCLNLGWTAKRFNEFDTGFYTREHTRQSDDGRTERIGKKYQWINWQTLLGFLSDNYEMTGDYGNVKRTYDNPGQLSYIEIIDPSRWISSIGKVDGQTSKAEYWKIASIPKWPDPNIQSMQNWIKSNISYFPSSDLITYCSEPLKDWGNGPWVNISAEHIWNYKFAPGLWGINQKFYADIWWQISPKLIAKDDLPTLLEYLKTPHTQDKLREIGRVDLPQNWNATLTDWPSLGNEFSQGLHDTSDSSWHDWFPINWMPMVATCGHPDHHDERGPVLLPWPSLFQMWNLEIDLGKGVIHKGGEVIFGISSWIYGEDALAARIVPLKQLLDDSGFQLVWIIRGERRAFLNWGSVKSHDQYVWVDLYGLSFLGPDLRVQTAWFDFKISGEF